MDGFSVYDIPWEEVEYPNFFHDPLPINQSAFIDYPNRSSYGFGSKMAVMEAVEAERERNHTHMINERIRREKERQSYDQLRKLLPHGTKRDKKSILQMATKKLEELKREKEKLEKRSQELEKALAVENNKAASSSMRKEEAKINIRVGYPSSGIDSMLEVLKCLKNKQSTAKSIQSKFSSLEFSAVLQIQTSIGAEEVEKAVQKTLYEVERKLRCPNLNSEEYMSNKQCLGRWINNS